MAALTNKRVLVGVTGGIAAYKSADLVRRLQDAGATVRVAMTPAATEFITPLTMQALSGHPVHLDLLDPAAEAAMGHIELARWADAIVVAPATADFIARLAHGEASDLLTTTCLASPSHLLLAPAMNQGMWHKPATQANLAGLRQRGVHLAGPESGSQACGDVGPGRMLEPPAITAAVSALFNSTRLTGKKVIITAGPTRESIDPVRYISNHSSGKMGYALAEAAVEAGARTVLISGPTALAPDPRAQLIPVISAAEMLEACLAELPGCHLFIAAAAVCDYRPTTVAPEKIKKTSARMTLNMEKNPDIVSLVARRTERPVTVGFAAETSSLEKYASEKRRSKNLDAIIANDVADSAIGFNSDNNRVLWIDAAGTEHLPLLSKSQLARRLVQKMANLLSD